MEKITLVEGDEIIADKEKVAVTFRNSFKKFKKKVRILEYQITGMFHSTLKAILTCRYHRSVSTITCMGAFTYYVITEGVGGVTKILTHDFRGVGGGLAL